MKEKQKSRKMMHAFAFLFLITCAAAILTYIIPAGEYLRETINGRTTVVAGSYHQVEQSPISPWGIFACVSMGWTSAADLIFLTFTVGAAIYVLEDTGTISAILGNLISKINGKEELLLIAISIVFSLLGATGAFSNAVVATVPLGVIIAKQLGYDSLVGFAITYVATFTGFSAGWANVFTTVIAQQVAELPILSGMPVRIAEHVIFMVIFLFFLLRYARKIRKDHSQSLSEEPMGETAETLSSGGVVTKRHIFLCVIAAVSFIVLIVGTMEFDFSTEDMSAVFIAMAVLVGLFGGLGISGTAVSFVSGLKSVCYAALLLGMAKSISVVLTEGNIIDTIVYYMSLPISSVHSVFGAQLMYVFNFLFNFVVPSGSGQALTVMPIMVPIADLSGITRQVCVEAYRFGDGLSNLLWPTVGSMMASLGIAKVEYTKYLKWGIPLVLCHSAVGFIIITVAQMASWGPF